MNTSSRLNDAHLGIARVCAVECALQGSGCQSVAWMLNGWAHAQRMTGPIIHDDVIVIAMHVEPQQNSVGYRRHNVEIRGNEQEKLPRWDDVPRLMAGLLDATGEYSPAEWFEQFQRVHPLGDGNGRTGLILFNYLNDSLDDPTWPPDPFDDQRRRPGIGLPL